MAVDLDLDRFFDRVQHDQLMAPVARRVTDKKVLRLIPRYRAAGVMANSGKQPTEEGISQGVPALAAALQRLLARAGAGIHRSLPPFPGRDANRRMRIRTVRWCGRGAGKPRPYPICQRRGRVKDT